MRAKYYSMPFLQQISCQEQSFDDKEYHTGNKVKISGSHKTGLATRTARPVIPPKVKLFVNLKK